MKKGIVLEQHRKYTIIMTEEGEFRKIDRVRDAEIGMEIQMDAKPKRRKIIPKMIPAAMIAVASLLLFLFQFNPSHQIYAYVVVDINPSVELQITEDMKVNRVRPINEDGEVIIDNLDNFKNREIVEVMAEIIHTSEEYGMINEDRNMLVGVSYTESVTEKEIPDPIERFAENNLEWNIATFYVPSEVREEAMESNTSMNEILAERLKEKSDISERLDDQNEELIHSFYNQEKEDGADEIEEDSSERSEEEVHEEREEQLEGDFTEEQLREEQEQPTDEEADDSDREQDHFELREDQELEKEDGQSAPDSPSILEDDAVTDEDGEILPEDEMTE